MQSSSIRPGQPRLDTNGNRIQAHGGSVICVDGTFYWYGEKEKTKHASGIWHWGVRCYSSKDLYNWEDRGLIIPPNLDDQTSPLHPSQAMDRPHIIYKRDTKMYFFQMFSSDIPMDSFNIPPEIRDPDTSIADYVWLPLRFEGDMVFLDWQDDWRIEHYE